MSQTDIKSVTAAKNIIKFKEIEMQTISSFLQMNVVRIKYSHNVNEYK